MAGYGYLSAKTFDFPLPQQQGPMEQPLLQGQPSEPEVQAPEGLQYHRDVTKSVYDKYYKLKSYASAMWKNYGIDVTKPDLTNDFSIKANLSGYTKGINF